MKEKTQENEKICQNCRYFLQHYIKSDIRFKKIFVGHCINGRLSKDKSSYDKACEFWETIEIRNEERKQLINRVLESMASQLQNISTVLTNDIKEEESEETVQIKNESEQISDSKKYRRNSKNCL